MPANATDLSRVDTVTLAAELRARARERIAQFALSEDGESINRHIRRIEELERVTSRGHVDELPQAASDAIPALLSCLGILRKLRLRSH